jgi:hypothetical protein
MTTTSGYLDPNEDRPFTPAIERMRIAAQSYEDRTIEFLYRAVAELGKRLTLAEGRLALLEAIYKDEL